MSDSTAVQRSESQDEIIPPLRKSEQFITKTTEIDVEEYDKDMPTVNRRAW